MKQLLQNLKTGETTVNDVPRPAPKPGTALVRTATSLVSAGTERMVVEFAGKSLVGKAHSRPDLVRQVVDKARREGLLTTAEAAFNRLDQPMPLGYSSAGTIVALGEGVQGFKVGERVACAGGGYAVHAEYAVVPVNLLAKIPEGVAFETAAFTTLGAIALHGFRLAEIQVGERVAVIGLGLLGLLAAGIAKAAGCWVFGVDLDPARVQLAAGMGIEAVMRPAAEEAAQAFTHGRGADAVLICADTTSNDPVTLAGAIARDRANVVAIGAVGLDLPRRAYFEKELNFINSRSYGPGRYDPTYEEGGVDYPFGYVRWTEGRNLEAVLDLMAVGGLDVDSLITHRFPIDEAPRTYELITGAREEPFLGVVLTYPEGDDQETTAAKPVKYEFPGVVGKPPASGAVKLGVVGAGNFAGAVMLPALKKIAAVDLVGIVSASGLNAAHAARKFGFRYAAESLEQLLGDSGINALAILTRHDLHASQVLAGLAAGKHVFVEKPLALNRDELSEIRTALATENSPLLMVGFNRRFAPLAVKLRAFLADRRQPLWMHYRVNAGALPLNHWTHDPAIGGGRIIGEGCHFIDFLTSLAGAPPHSVGSHGLPDQGQFRDDNLVMTFTFPDGSLGTLSYLANGDKAFSKERVEIFCGGRVAVLDDFRRLELVRDGKRQVIRSRFRQDKGHQAEWESFTAAITTGDAPPIPYNHLFGVTEATFAAIDSLRRGVQIDIHSKG
jgi:predicted dehydrogenase